MTVSRRDFLIRSAPLIALSPSLPCFMARTARAAAAAERDGRVLVVIQLDGGNDGINTVVPFRDPGYARCRRELRLPQHRLLKLNDGLALHPDMADAAKLWESARLTIVQGVGYPNPDRSHFRSMAIWHTARFDPEEHDGLGWLGRALDEAPPPAAGPAALLVGDSAPPAALRGRRAVAASLERLDDLVLARGAAPSLELERSDPLDDVEAYVRRRMADAFTTAGQLAQATRGTRPGLAYPTTRLAAQLQLVARLLKAGVAARLFYTIQRSYDSHSLQFVQHGPLLSEFAGAMRSFLDDLADAGLAERVAVMAFSEFGRRPAENASQGTDHGTAGPMFLAGPRVKPGLVGETPKLLDLDEGDLKVGIDFRRVYATVLHDWLNLPMQPSLAGDFDRLPLFRGE